MDSIESILDFSFPEVIRDPLQKDPSYYKDFLVNSINRFIAFMVKYVKDHRTTPNLVGLIEAFLRRMEAQWSMFSYKIMNSSYVGFTGADSSWEYELIDVKEKSDYDKNVKDDADFSNFSKEFYKLITQQGRDDMHDLNQLISIVLLGGYENIRYYIDKPQNQSANVMSEHGASRIDMRDVNQRQHSLFIQMHRSPGETQYIENAPIIPLFVRLAAFIVKTPESTESELLSQLDKNAVGQAVDNAIRVAEAKKAAAAAAAAAAAEAKVEAAHKAFEVSEASGNASRSVIGADTISVKGGRRTRHKRSGHKRSGHKRSGHKRSGKRSNKRSGKRSGKR
jgi:hypothetical protein